MTAVAAAQAAETRKQAHSQQPYRCISNWNRMVLGAQKPSNVSYLILLASRLAVHKSSMQQVKVDFQLICTAD